MHQPAKLDFLVFDKTTCFSAFPNSTQKKYLLQYLESIGAHSVIIERNYFDKDYLDEFSHFYSKSARGYQNICERWHFFSLKVDRDFFLKALEEVDEKANLVKDSYLGFCVIRPLTITPFGHTVLSQYKDTDLSVARVVCSRLYHTHVAGFNLSVTGLSWQQQDTAVGACATISLWTALHSSSFDEYHAIPTTAQITIAAHKTASLGSRIFPSNGLNVYQVCEAIKELGLSPMLQSGDLANGTFSKERFLASCCSLISSGYPVIVLGALRNDFHAVCFTGYRPALGSPPIAEQILLEDAYTDVFYMHDDNIGPYVRMKVTSVQNTDSMELITEVSAKAAPGGNTQNEMVEGFGKLVPMHIIAAVNNELRTSIDFFNNRGIEISSQLVNTINTVLASKGMNKIGCKVGVRFKKTINYIENEVGNLFIGNPGLKARVRLELWEDVAPMSYYIGVIRTEIASHPFADFLIDTTDNIHNNDIFASICFSEDSYNVLSYFKSNGLNLGHLVKGF